MSETAVAKVIRNAKYLDGELYRPVDREEMLVVLLRLTRFPGAVKKLADKVGCHENHIYAMRSGVNPVSKKVIETLEGFRCTNGKGHYLLYWKRIG